MDIEKNWQKINGEDDGLEHLMDAKQLSKLTSTAPLAKLKRYLLFNICLGMVIMIGTSSLLYYFPQWPVRLAIAVFLVFAGWTVAGAIKIYRQLLSFKPAQNNLLAELKQHYNTIQQWSSSQQLVALFIYPIAATGGFIMGGVSGSQLEWTVFMSKPAVLVTLLITLIIVTPISYYLARWMMNYTFGKLLSQLKENIELLSAA